MKTIKIRAKALSAVMAGGMALMPVVSIAGPSLDRIGDDAPPRVNSVAMRTATAADALGSFLNNMTAQSFLAERNGVLAEFRLLSMDVPDSQIANVKDALRPVVNDFLKVQSVSSEGMSEQQEMAKVWKLEFLNSSKIQTYLGDEEKTAVAKAYEQIDENLRQQFETRMRNVAAQLLYDKQFRNGNMAEGYNQALDELYSFVSVSRKTTAAGSKETLKEAQLKPFDDQINGYADADGTPHIILPKNWAAQSEARRAELAKNFGLSRNAALDDIYRHLKGEDVAMIDRPVSGDNMDIATMERLINGKRVLLSFMRFMHPVLNDDPYIGGNEDADLLLKLNRKRFQAQGILKADMTSGLLQKTVSVYLAGEDLGPRRILLMKATFYRSANARRFLATLPDRSPVTAHFTVWDPRRVRDHTETPFYDLKIERRTDSKAASRPTSMALWLPRLMGNMAHPLPMDDLGRLSVPTASVGAASEGNKGSSAGKNQRGFAALVPMLALALVSVGAVAAPVVTITAGTLTAVGAVLGGLVGAIIYRHGLPNNEGMNRLAGMAMGAVLIALLGAIGGLALWSLLYLVTHISISIGFILN